MCRILSRVAYATSLFDQDGIQVRFMNNRTEGNNISTEQQALQLVQQVKFSGTSIFISAGCRDTYIVEYT